MAKDPNAKINKAIGKKTRDAALWRSDATKADRLGDHELAKILRDKARKAEAEILNLKMKLK